MSTLKILFKDGDKETVFYGEELEHTWQVESHILERLSEEECCDLSNADFHKYWIDDEGDTVPIKHEDDYDFFLKRASSGTGTPEIYVEPRRVEKNQQQQLLQQDGQSLTVHKSVSCEMCKVKPVVGFRYKCVQCPDYDLCMNCEAEMKHPQHLMLRIPECNMQIFNLVNDIRYKLRYVKPN